MIRIHSQMHHIDKYLQHNCLASSVKNDLVIVYKLSGFRFQSCLQTREPEVKEGKVVVMKSKSQWKLRIIKKYILKEIGKVRASG